MISEQLRSRLEALHTASFAWAVRCCYQDRLAAEEVLQMTYLKILEGKAKFDQKSQFKTWLFSVIRFTAIDYFKKEKKVKLASYQHLNVSNSELSTLNTSQIVFERGLTQLSPKQSRLLHLVFYQNLTIQAAAEVMNIQVGTARTHYERGKEQLRKWLAKAGYTVNGKFVLPQE